jgi:hypothetical protein
VYAVECSDSPYDTNLESSPSMEFSERLSALISWRRRLEMVTFLVVTLLLVDAKVPPIYI